MAARKAPAKKRLQKLLFKVGKFHDGINVTVRDGNKWFGQTGDILIVSQDEEGNEIAQATGEIIGSLYTNVGDIPDNILKLEHDKDCTSTRGIWRELERVYNKAFGFYDKVTVLFFKVTNRDF
jgi:hypothetical protein